MTSLCFLEMQLADRVSILSKGSCFVYIISISLLLNHSPSEWFSIRQEKGGRIAALFFMQQYLPDKQQIRTPLQSEQGGSDYADLVETKRIELSTLRMRTVRSPS